MRLNRILLQDVLHYTCEPTLILIHARDLGTVTAYKQEVFVTSVSLTMVRSHQQRDIGVSNYIHGLILYVEYDHNFSFVIY